MNRPIETSRRTWLITTLLASTASISRQLESASLLQTGLLSVGLASTESKNISAVIPVETVKIRRQLPLRTSGSHDITYPTALVANNDGELYICDNNSHKIIRITSDWSKREVFCPMRKGEQLEWPTSLRRCTNNEMLVSDNDGIKLLRQDGSIARTIVSFFGVFDFWSVDGDRVYINPVFRPSAIPRPRLVELDREGNCVAQCGSIPLVALDGFLLNRSFVIGQSDQIIAVSKHEPMIRSFSPEHLKSLSETELRRLGQLQCFKELRYSVTNQGGDKVRSFFAGASLCAAGLFLLVDSPTLTILRVDINDGTVSAYHAERTEGWQAYHGFDVTSEGGSVKFWTIVRIGDDVLRLLQIA